MFETGHIPAVLILVGLIGQGIALNLNDACTNPAGQPGRCILFRECQPLVAIYQKPLILPDEGEFISNSRCGVHSGSALVCCAGVPQPQPAGNGNKLPKPNACGLDLSDRIFGGQPTDLDEFPWTALINYRKPNGNTGFHCGGSLITSRYTITAAHCINAIPRGWSVIGVRLGEYDIKNEKDCIDDICTDGPVDMDIEKITVHENYNPQGKNQYDDIALIRFTRDVSFSAYISPICLPADPENQNRQIVGTKAVAAGWGRTETASSSSVKLKVELDIFDWNRCSTVYKPSGVTLRDTQICAGGLRGKDTCSGDSGGPLMKRIKSNYFLYGIVSFGPNKCGTKDVPGVYTNVPKYINWVENNIV